MNRLAYVALGFAAALLLGGTDNGGYCKEVGPRIIRFANYGGQALFCTIYAVNAPQGEEIVLADARFHITTDEGRPIATLEPDPDGWEVLCFTLPGSDIGTVVAGDGLSLHESY